MECKHCGASFEQQEKLKGHLQHHVEIQKRVYPGRSYGAVYRRAPARSTETSTSNGTLLGYQSQETPSHTIEGLSVNLDRYSCRFCRSTFADRFVYTVT
ncbi:hypothetical protein BDW72DRAFT_181623 [Aspergillus terricola var. indicus]